MDALALYNTMLEKTGDPIAAAVATLAQVIEGQQAQATTEKAEFLTVKQAAEKYTIGERTIYRMVEDGLPVTRVGKAIRIKPRDLAKRLAASENLLR
jgi:excisionase family DNA binding protein